ncbi:hypothetical protein DB346_22210 [Verrucomicrobia bacterium LW23]|nr:hypothetical protein DB346_22210 [Verrucomicrobia bacterium LW23]
MIYAARHVPRVNAIALALLLPFAAGAVGPGIAVAQEQPAAAEAAPEDGSKLSRENVGDTIRLMILALEAEKPDYETFLYEYTYGTKNRFPEEVKDMAAKVGPRMVLTLKVLKAIVNRAPTSTSEVEVVYSVADLVKGSDAPDKIKFVRTEGKWYLK